MNENLIVYEVMFYVVGHILMVIATIIITIRCGITKGWVSFAGASLLLIDASLPFVTNGFVLSARNELIQALLHSLGTLFLGAGLLYFALTSLAKKQS